MPEPEGGYEAVRNPQDDPWLFAELERAAAEFRAMPEWAKPVVTASSQRNPSTPGFTSTERNPSSAHSFGLHDGAPDPRCGVCCDRPWLADICCCAGGASKGYARAGFYV